MRAAFYNAEIDPDYRSGANPMTGGRISASTALLDLMPSMPEHAVSFDWLSSALGERSIGLVLVLLGLVATLPGASVIAGLLMIGPACQLLVGSEVSILPRFLADRRIAPRNLASALRIAIPPLRYFERFSRPRLRLFTGVMERTVGAAILLMDVFLFLPVPLSNVAPAIMIALLALAYTEDDGLLLGISLAGALIMLATAPILMWHAVQLAF